MENTTDEKCKTKEIYRKVRGVLNNLTPQKFETLISQVRALPIDNSERLQGVVNLVFEKAVNEPNSLVAYALMCRELALMQVPANNKKKEFVNFRQLLITRCQLEFENNSVDEITRNGRMKEIEECTDPEKKKELQVSLEEEGRRIRRKSVGNIRFIGELFKQKMLSVNIMLRCTNNLLADKDEESLECLCELLTTVGKEVEAVKKTDLLPIFAEMKDIVDKKHGKISSRVRYMLQDVIDLRNAKWVPRCQDRNPKTMDQIQKKAQPRIDEPLGSVLMFGQWGSGSNIKTSAPAAAPPNTANMFAAREKIGNETDKRTMHGSRSKEPYSSKGPSLERGNKQSYEDEGSMSGSHHNSQCSTPKPVHPQSLPKSNPPVSPKPLSASEEMSPKQLELKLKNILEEYLNDYYTIAESDEGIKGYTPSSALSQLLVERYHSKSTIKSDDLPIAVTQEKRGGIDHINSSATGGEASDFAAPSHGSNAIFTELLMPLEYNSRSAVKPNDLFGTTIQEEGEFTDINKYPTGRVKDFTTAYDVSSCFDISSSQRSLPSKCSTQQETRLNAPTELYETNVELENKKSVVPNTEYTVENDTYTIPTIPMKEDQHRKQICDTEFLRALRGEPKSEIEPDILIDGTTQEEKQVVANINRYPTGRAKDFSCDDSSFFVNSSPPESASSKCNNQQDTRFIAPMDSNGSDEVELAKFLQLNTTSMIEDDTGIDLSNVPDKEDLSFDQPEQNIYDREFLMALRYSPKSMTKPDNLPDTISLDNGRMITDIDGPTIDLTPKCKSSNTLFIDQSGKKIYDKQFLMALRYSPKSMIEPNNLLNAHEEIRKVADGIKFANEKLFQPNAEAIIGNDTSVVDTIPDLYDLPFNQGKKIYDKEFLMALRCHPKSKIKPDNLLASITREEKQSLPKRNNGNVTKGKSQANNIASSNIREDLKLHELENTLNSASYVSNMTGEEYETQELYRKVRGVLNQLTPQNFETLISQVRALPIDNEERLDGVIDLVFEKAIDEPKFSVTCALLCRELALLQVAANDEKEEFVNFRKLLTKRCELIFHKNEDDEVARNLKIKEIEDCIDPEKKKLLQLLLQEQDNALRRKSTRNITFIGLLFKQQMLTVNFMLRCLNKLLSDNDEESIECLCIFLATMNKEVECIQEPDLIPTFEEFKEIVDGMQYEISARAWLMLQGVIVMLNGFVHAIT